MKKLLLLVVTCALLVPPVAFARDWGQGFGGRVQAQGQGQPVKKRPGQIRRGDRDIQRGGPDRHDQGRLTREERQGLHRDLDRADREIYRR